MHRIVNEDQQFCHFFNNKAQVSRYTVVCIHSYLHLMFSPFVILLVAVANTYACKGLDRIEEKLPILNQPTNQVSLAGSTEAYCLTCLSLRALSVEHRLCVS